MAWHQWAFYTSLTVWVIVISFRAPYPSPKRGYPTTTTWPYSWYSFLMTVICAGIMYVGYRRLKLYLERISDALATVRTRRNPRGIHGTRSEESVMVTRAFVECHNQLASFLSNYSREIEEIEGKIRTNVLSMIEDVESWKADLDTILQQSRRGSSLQSPGFTETAPEEVRALPRESDRLSPPHEQPATPQRPAAPKAFNQKGHPAQGRVRKVVQPPKLILNQDAKEQQLKTLRINLRRLDRHIERLGLDSPPITKDFRRHSCDPQLPSVARQSTFGMKDKAAIMEAKQRRQPPLLLAVHPVRGTSGTQEHKVDMKLPRELPPLHTDDAMTGSEIETATGSEMSENPPEAAGTPSPGAALAGSEVKETLRKAVPEETEREREMEPNVGPPVEFTSETEMVPKEELAQCKEKATTALSQEPSTSHHSQPVGSFVPEPSGSFDMEAQESDGDLIHLERGSETSQEPDYVSDVKSETPTVPAPQGSSRPKALVGGTGLAPAYRNEEPKRAYVGSVSR